MLLFLVTLSLGKFLEFSVYFPSKLNVQVLCYHYALSLYKPLILLSGECPKLIESGCPVTEGCLDRSKRTYLVRAGVLLPDFSAPYPGNIWLVQLGILHCSLWPVQTINFPCMGAREFARKRNQQYLDKGGKSFK